jgi:hypothetical protein
MGGDRTILIIREKLIIFLIAIKVYFDKIAQLSKRTGGVL